MTTSAEAFEKIHNAEPDLEGYITRPLLVLSNQVVYPQVLMPLGINAQENQAVMQQALKIGQTVIAVKRRSDAAKDDLSALHEVGTEIALGQITEIDEISHTVLAQGRRRVRIISVDDAGSYPTVKAVAHPDVMQDKVQIGSLMQAVIELFRHTLEFNDLISDEVADYILSIDDPSTICDLIAATVPLEVEERQTLLEESNVSMRLEQLAMMLAKETSVMEIRDEVNNQVQEEMARMQREMYLREQMRVIQTELGEEDLFQQELNELRDRIQKAELSPEALDRANRELARLNIMPPMAPESAVIRTYIDWLLDVPWTKTSDDNLDLNNAEKILDEDHYGLKKIKDRVLEHIAVRKLAQDKMKSPILCFVGPPGVGKTSLGKSIARALGREFVRVSLGGVYDESEIRGHRRTYIGSLPGRIIQTLKRAGTVNPVFMLDEIDKLGLDYRGDPAAALLEVLDPEQNNEFSDHYLEIPYDLSKVLFITTANDLYPIPEALEDRMEVIEFRGYTEEEKIQIARQFLIPKQLEANGVDNLGVRFETAALQTLIRDYTYEAGVRNLEREIGNICRKITRLVASEKAYPKRITAKIAVDLLGPPQFSRPYLNRVDDVGIVTGLVWTSNGGDIQMIEVSIVPGKGTLTLTGQLGDVLQESAQAALSYMRYSAIDLDVPYDDFDNYDVHIHMPEGAVPKDGPSAGVTLATAIVSAFTERVTRSDYAMTGEITLRGHVLPVGGVKEKVLAARRHRIPNVILPAENQKDLVEIPKQALKDLNIIFVEHIEQVLDLVLLPAPEQRQRDLENQEEQSELSGNELPQSTTDESS